MFNIFIATADRISFHFDAPITVFYLLLVWLNEQFMKVKNWVENWTVIQLLQIANEPILKLISKLIAKMTDQPIQFLLHSPKFWSDFCLTQWLAISCQFTYRYWLVSIWEEFCLFKFGIELNCNEMPKSVLTEKNKRQMTDDQ